MRKIAVITDSASDLPQDIVRRYGIYVLQLKIIYGGVSYTDSEISPEEVYRRFPAEIPTTSAPNLQEAITMVDLAIADGAQQIIGVCVSSRISSSYTALEMALKERPQIESCILDSRGISCSSGLCALWAAEQIEAGMPYAQIREHVLGMAAHTAPFFTMDSLDYLVKGGRLSPAAAAVGTLIGIKPIITCNPDGRYVVAAKPRGMQNSLARLLDLVVNFAGQGKVWLALESGRGAPENLDWMRRQLAQNLPNAVLMINKQITATMAVHTGPGLVGVSVLNGL